MTENEAKYYLLESMPIVGFKTHNEALDVAINALSEIQQYRAYNEIFESHFSKEALEFLRDKEEFGKWLERGKWIAKRCDEINRELEQYRAIGTIEEVRMLKDYKELYDVYKLIGTIEEFRNLKYKKNVLPIATIEFSKEDMQKIVDEKVAQIELNIQEIRAKAIDEFISKLEKHTQENWIDHQEYGITWADIEQVAEQMKGGAE